MVARLVAIAVCLLTFAVPVQAAPVRDSGRYIVEFSDAPLALAPREVVGRGLLARTAFNRLDADSPASQAYLNRLSRQQDSAIDRLRAVLPQASIERRYGVLINGVAVRGARPEDLADLPGAIRVSPESRYSTSIYPDVEQIGGTALWSDVGGPSAAGAGVKIAILDSGIAIGHPSFNPAGYAYPAGFPKGDTTQTTPKVIVARSYIRPDDPARAGDSGPTPRPGADSHGTHVAGTAAGVAGVLAVADGVQVPISGVAPAAYLMNYRVFYASVSESDFVSGNAFTIELVAALEDAVRDGADVISNSWGASYTATEGWADPMVRALDAAAAAGVAIAQAAGNDGPWGATSNNPSNADGVVAVGAVTTSSEIARDFVRVVDGPPELDRIRYARSGTRLPTPTAPMAIRVPGTDGCAALPPIDGVVLLARGTCPFQEKLVNAQNAGASAVLFVNATDDRFSAGVRDARIPVGMIGAADGAALSRFVTANPAARLILDPNGQVVGTTADTIADFSSRGPSTDLLLKPDVVAPGVNILAAGYGPAPNPLAGFGQVSGTSMATPHVAGALALLRQRHPDWSPVQLKAALMGTAVPAVSGPAGLLGPVDRGAGRIDLVKAVNPALLAVPSSVSFGAIPIGDSPSITVKLSGVAARTRYRATVGFVGTAGPAVRVTPDSFDLGPGETVDLRVTLDPGDSPAGDYQGDIVLTGDSVARLPFWARLMPERERPLLLIDNDGSEESGDLPNGAGAYRQALGTLGIGYDLLNAEEVRRTPPTAAALNRYRLIVLFTGSRDTPVIRRPSLSMGDQDALADYLNSGGRLIVFGRSPDGALDLNPMQDALFGRGRLFHGYLGATVRGSVPAAGSVSGVDGSPLGGKRFTLIGDGNLPLIEPYREDSDTYLAPATILPLVTADGRNVGIFRAATGPRKEFRYRTALLGFGLDDVAEQDRVPLLKALIDGLGAPEPRS